MIRDSRRRAELGISRARELNMLNGNFTTTRWSHTVLPIHYAKNQLVMVKRMSPGAHSVHVCVSSVDAVPVAHFLLRCVFLRFWGLSHGLQHLQK